MFSSMTLEVLLALSITYTGLSILCSVVAEWIAKYRRRRATLLREYIGVLLNDGAIPKSDLALLFYQHPSIVRLGSKAVPPSYVSSKLFSLVIIDLFVLLNPPTASDPGTTVIRSKATDPEQTAIPAGTKTLLNTILSGTSGSIGHAQDRLEKWFDELMQRLEGVYKRETKRYILMIAFALVMILNIDTLKIAKAVLAQPATQSALQEAGKAAPADKSDIAGQFVFLWQTIQSVPLPIGWIGPEAKVVQQENGRWSILEKLIGLYLSIVAVAFGTPFWFDVVNKIVNIRQVGQKPATTIAR